MIFFISLLSVTLISTVTSVTEVPVVYATSQDECFFNIFKNDGSSLRLNCTCGVEKLDIEKAVKIRDDYQLTPTVGLHKYHHEPVTFNVARKICIEEGGHLAILNSKLEEQALLSLVTSSPSTAAKTTWSIIWVGFHGLYEKGEWVTVLGDSIHKAGYDLWAAGQPDNLNDIQVCGALMETGKFHDAPCEARLSFLGEIELVH